MLASQIRPPRRSSLGSPRFALPLIVAAFVSLGALLGQPSEGRAAEGRVPGDYATGTVDCYWTRDLRIAGPHIGAISGQTSTYVSAAAWYRLSWDGTNWGGWNLAKSYPVKYAIAGFPVTWDAVTVSGMPTYGRGYVVEVMYGFYWWTGGKWSSKTAMADQYTSWANYIQAPRSDFCVFL